METSVAKRVAFDLPSTPESVNRVGRMLDTFFDRQGLSGGVTFDIKLAAQEAVVNAAEHGNKSDPEKQVHVTCEATDGAITATVRDEGCGFDPACVPDPTLPENILRESGRGVFLMRNLCDDIRFNKTGNEVILVKYLRGDKPPAS